MNENKTNTIMTADMFLEQLADPIKLKNIKQTAKIVENKNDDENNDSYIVNINNDTDKHHIDMDFNTDHKKDSPKKDKLSPNKTLQDKFKEQPNDQEPFIKPKERSRSRISSRKCKTQATENLMDNIKLALDNPNIKDVDNNVPNITNINTHPILPSPPPPLNNNITNTKMLNPIELKKRKLDCLAKLMYLKSIGMQLTGTYSKDSDLEELEAELKYQTDLQSKKDGIELCKSAMCNIITGIEYLNDRYDPFKFNLKGWSNQIKSNKNDYDNVFCELLEKYKGSGTKIEPELKLAMMIGLSAFTYHTSKTINTGLLEVDEFIEKNPELLTQLTSKIDNVANKNIAGKSEYDKQYEIYETVKQARDNMKSSKNKDEGSKQINSNNESLKKNIIDDTKKDKSSPKTTKEQIHKPGSIKNLVRNIKKVAHQDTASESNKISFGQTIDTENNTSDNRPSVSNNVRTKRREMNKNNVQVKSD